MGLLSADGGLAFGHFEVEKQEIAKSRGGRQEVHETTGRRREKRRLATRYANLVRIFLLGREPSPEESDSLLSLARSAT